MSVVSETQTISATSPRQTPCVVITHSRHNESIRYCKSQSSDLSINWAGHGYKGKKADRRGAGRRIASRDKSPHSVKVTAGGDGDAHRGGTERFLTTGERRTWFEASFPAGFITLLSENCFFWSITLLSIGCHQPGQHAQLSGVSPWRTTRRQERSRQSHFGGWKAGRVGGDHLPSFSESKVPYLPICTLVIQFYSTDQQQERIITLQTSAAPMQRAVSEWNVMLVQEWQLLNGEQRASRGVYVETGWLASNDDRVRFHRVAYKDVPSLSLVHCFASTL